MRRTLIVLAKAPRLGAVKSRLAADIGDVAAWVWYRRQLDAVLRRLRRGGRWRRLLAVTPDRGGDRWPRGWTVMAQGRGDLGRRMMAALGRAGPGHAVLVGADIPDLEPRHIAQAFRALGRHGAVFGPTPDGGFWLVGLRRPMHAGRWFRGVRWSTASALADTLENRANVAVGLVGRLADIDTGADLAAWRARRGCLTTARRSRCRPGTPEDLPQP